MGLLQATHVESMTKSPAIVSRDGPSLLWQHVFNMLIRRDALLWQHVFNVLM